MSANPCVQPVGNPALVSLVIPTQTSSGSDSWAGFPGDEPQLSGDNFELFGPGFAIEAPLYGTNEHGCGIGAGPCGYSLSWDEVDDQLTSVSVTYRAPSFQAQAGLDGGSVATDGSVDGCFGSECQFTGFWADPPGAPIVGGNSIAGVPEPMTLSVWTLGLLAAWRKRNHGPGAKVLEKAQ